MIMEQAPPPAPPKEVASMIVESESSNSVELKNVKAQSRLNDMHHPMSRARSVASTLSNQNDQQSEPVKRLQDSLTYKRQ